MSPEMMEEAVAIPKEEITLDVKENVMSVNVQL